MALKTPASAAASKIEGQFDDTPAGWQKYWSREFSASREEGSEDWPGIRNWQERANKVVRRYRNNRKGLKRAGDARINIFPANVQTQRAILVGNTPSCEVTRRFEDPDDDVARVAADMLERLLNTGLEEESRGLAATLSKCTEDRLLPGMCGSRVQFSVEFEQVEGKPAMMAPCPACQGSGAGLFSGPQPCAQCQGAGQVEQAPAIPAQTRPTNESADAVYVNWRDQLWSACRTSDELRWWAYGADMSREQLKAMFVEGADVPLNVAKTKSRNGEARKETPWSRARVWEIWSKEHERIFWLVEGFTRCLTNKENPQGSDPLGLEDFFPSPLPMMANVTTDALIPTPDFEYAEDLYNEADDLTTRIRNIVRAVKVAGVYDGTSKEVRRLLDEACELQLLPASNWGELMQKGGLAGAFQLLPVKEMVETVQVLVAQRNSVIESIYQITGLGDIIRGQQQQSETATTSAIKARFASVRLQDMQKEVARYATDLQRLRKEVIAKHWSIRTIIERSCILRGQEGKTPEGQERVMQAAQLIKDRHLDFCVAVKPEQVALQDWTVLKQQRTEVLTALGQYHAAMMPFLQMCMQGGPETVKAGIQLVFRNGQSLVAGMPGGSGVESNYDSFVAQVEKIAEQAAQQPPQPPPPDPKLQAAQVKAQAEMTKAKAGIQQSQVDGQVHAAKAGMDLQVAQAQHGMDMAKIEAQQRAGVVRQVDQLLGPQGAA